MAGVCEGECMGHSSGDETLTLTRCHSCGVVRIRNISIDSSKEGRKARE